jgi:hypothetical protein
MHASPFISSAAVINAASIAAGILAGYVVLRFLQPAPSMLIPVERVLIIAPGAAAPAHRVNWAGKGDRSDGRFVDPRQHAGAEMIQPATSTKSSNDAAKSISYPPRMKGCEPVASPIAEPALARFSGRCFAQLTMPTHLAVRS